MKINSRNKKNGLRIVALLALALLVSSCSTMADVFSFGAQIAGATGLIDENFADSISNTTQAIGRAAEVITPEQEYYIGRAVAANILGNYSLYYDAEVEAYLNKICGAITVNSERPELYRGYHVAIMDTDEINAFATPGGHILISRGLLNCASSEDALAAVIAHEVAHIQLQHSVKAIKSARTVDAIFSTAGTVVTAFAEEDLRFLSDVFGETVNEVVGQLVESGYSKNQEYDADAFALKLMADAGYNPFAMVEMLRLIEDIQGDSNRGFGKTHPSPEDRLDKVLDELRDYITYDGDDSARVERFSEMR